MEGFPDWVTDQSITCKLLVTEAQRDSLRAAVEPYAEDCVTASKTASDRHYREAMVRVSGHLKTILSRHPEPAAVLARVDGHMTDELIKCISHQSTLPGRSIYLDNEGHGRAVTMVIYDGGAAPGEPPAEPEAGPALIAAERRLNEIENAWHGLHSSMDRRRGLSVGAFKRIPRIREFIEAIGAALHGPVPGEPPAEAALAENLQKALDMRVTLELALKSWWNVFGTAEIDVAAERLQKAEADTARLAEASRLWRDLTDPQIECDKEAVSAELGAVLSGAEYVNRDTARLEAVLSVLGEVRRIVREAPVLRQMAHPENTASMGLAREIEAALERLPAILCEPVKAERAAREQVEALPTYAPEFGMPARTPMGMMQIDGAAWIRREDVLAILAPAPTDGD